MTLTLFRGFQVSVWGSLGSQAVCALLRCKLLSKVIVLQQVHGLLVGWLCSDAPKLGGGEGSCGSSKLDGSAQLLLIPHHAVQASSLITDR